jgi:type IV pilus assembly protein PilM
VFKRKQRATPVVGLELDPSHIAAAEVAENGSISVKRGAVAPLRAGVLRDGEVAEPQALSEALKTLFAEHELPNRVRLGLANQRIVVRTLDLPRLDDDNALGAAVKVEAPDHIPMAMDEAILDWQRLGAVQTSAGARTRVVVVAVRREIVDRLVGVVADAGLELEGIDLSAFGMVRALRANRRDGAALYVSVGGLTNVAVANEHGCLFTRAAAGGHESMVHTLADRRGLTIEHSQQWLRHVGLLAELDDVEGDEDIVKGTRTVLEDGVRELADTVRNSLNFYRTQDGAEPVEEGFITGPAVEIPGFAETLSEQLKLPLEVRVVAAESEDADLARLTVAAGLAVEDIV